MKELLEFLKTVVVAEIVLFRTSYVTSCHVVYYDSDKLYVRYFQVTDFDAFNAYLKQHYTLFRFVEEIQYVPIQGEISFV